MQATYTRGVLGDLGGFGGLFRLKDELSEDPILVSGTDGVGTKLRLAIEMGIHHTIGQDCVAMSVNDDAGLYRDCETGSWADGGDCQRRG